MFSNTPKKTVSITVEDLYINQHSNIRTNIKMPPNTVITSHIIKQVGKNGKEIEFNRVVVPYNDFYIIMNLYQDINTKKFYGKTLTVLTEGQLRTSRNMNAGKSEGYSLKITIKNFKQEDKFFAYKEYLDYLNQLSV